MSQVRQRVLILYTVFTRSGLAIRVHNANVCKEAIEAGAFTAEEAGVKR